MDAQKTKDLEVAGRFVLVTVVASCVFSFLARLLLVVDDGEGVPTSMRTWMIGLGCWALAVLVAAIDLRHNRRSETPVKP